MILRSTIAGLVSCITLLALGQEAAAQECAQPSSPEEARQLAGAAFSEGQALFQAENYAQALTRFECSFSLVPHHNTLYNIGECKEAMGNLVGALAAYREYIRRYPDVEGRSAVEARIGAVVARMDTTAREPTPQPAEPAAPTPAPTPAPGPTNQPTEPVAGAAAAPPPPAAPATRMTLARRLAWVSLATGVAFAALGGGLYGAALSQHDEFAAAQDDPDYTQADLEDLQRSGQGLEGAGIAFMVLGGAVLATAVVLFAAFAGREPAAGAHTGPTLAIGPLQPRATGFALTF